jgi:hypothetical protein
MSSSMSCHINKIRKVVKRSLQANFPVAPQKGLSVKQTEITIVPEGSTSEQIMMMSEVFTLLTFFLSTQEGT